MDKKRGLGFGVQGVGIWDSRFLFNGVNGFWGLGSPIRVERRSVWGFSVEVGISERPLCEDWALSEVLPSTAYLVYTQGVG